MERTEQYLEQKAVFMDSCSAIEQGNKLLFGIPMDSTTSFRPGTRLAPYRIREVSEGIEEYSVYQNKGLSEISFCDAGDLISPFGNVGESLRRAEFVSKCFLQEKKKLFVVGGEHLVSLPVIKAYHSFFPDLAVIQLDAHADLREDYLGEKMSHATVMRQVAELLKPRSVFQLGIRSGTREEMEYAAEKTSLYLDKAASVADEVKHKVKDRPVYITLDIDVLDPAFAPGTGTPEAGGITSRELFTVLWQFKELNVVGFDLVEISPPYDQGDVTAILGAKIIREALLAY
jgi:agmatinase